MSHKSALIIALLLGLSPGLLRGQDSSTYSTVIPITVSLFNNQTTLPIGMKLGMLRSPVHPGIAIGSFHTWRYRTKYELRQTATLGYYYHQYSQHGIQFYTEFQHLYKPTKWLYTEAGAGLGYLHAIQDGQTFTLNDLGEYVKKSLIGLPRFMISTHIGLFVPVKKEAQKTQANCTMCRTAQNQPMVNGVFIRYQFWLEAPFVKNYVPLLPNTALHIGYATFIKYKNKADTK